ncbi:hypothetical protein OIU84_010044 [Salix udensis]|uniref:Clathrin interactor EPSIN 1 n=1 Tax=Salix udensis TaxID=889485 RepID=A0AAD6JJU5_9ROSI|nr:hypothetical protein OIU84_010044 [Salix udensis]
MLSNLDLRSKTTIPNTTSVCWPFSFLLNIIFHEQQATPLQSLPYAQTHRHTHTTCLCNFLCFVILFISEYLFCSKDQGNMSSRASKSSANLNASDKKNSVSSNYDDDDFDPRGTSSTKSASQTPNQVDLFGESLLGDLMDAPTSVPTEALVMNANSEEVDLFADAAFVSAPPQAGKEGSSETQTRVDLFTSQPAYTSAVPSTFDFFSSDEPVAQPGIEAPKSDPPNTNVNDPFAAVAMNNFDGSDLFGSLASSNPPQKEGFQVKSGIWADSLSRGLIDLNISAPKKVSLVDVGCRGRSY